NARHVLCLAFHYISLSGGRFRPPAGGRGTLHHWKVPKGCRGRPKAPCGMAAPGPPVAKEQCAASLAGARPARFTSVPGRATVAYKVGFHFVKAKSPRDPRIRLWRKRGLAQLIPPPAFGRRVILGVPARGRHDSAPRRRNVPWHWGKGKYVAKLNFFCRFFPIFVGGTASLIRWGKFTNYSGNPKENHLDSPGNSFYD